MKKRKIQVPKQGGEFEEVEAHIWGRFGIHRTITDMGFYRHYWTLTHLASGYAVSVYADSVDAAVRLARMMNRCGINWNFRKVPPKLIGHRKGKEVVARWEALEAIRHAKKAAS